IVPTIPQYLKSNIDGKTTFRKIELADLLPRKETRLDVNSISHIIEGKTVLVTGAGGTIGSELCRQLIRFRPHSLLMLEKNNNSLFYIERALRRLPTNTKILPLAGDVQDR